MGGTTLGFWGTTAPPGSFTADSSAREIGMLFFSFQPGQVTGVRYWKDAGNTDVSRTARLWDQHGTLLASAAFTEPETAGWNTATFASPVTINGLATNTTPAAYMFTVSNSSGYFKTSTQPLLPVQNVTYPLVMICGGDTSWVPPFGNGYHTATPGAFPNSPTNGDIYGIDLIFTWNGPLVPSVDYTYWRRWARGFPADPSFFPLQVWDQDPSVANSGNLYKALGINTFTGLFNWPPDTGQIAAAHADGLHVIGGGVNGDTSGPAFYNANPVISTAAVGYQLGDEFDGTDPETGATVQGYAAAVRAVDSTRFIYLGGGGGWSTFINVGYAGNHLTVGDYQAQINAADVIGADFYGMTAGQLAYPGIWVYGRTVDNLRTWASDAKPVFGVVEVNNPFGDSDSDGRVPTVQQIQNCVWMCLIHGARGIIYFDHRFYTPGDFATLISGNYPAIAAGVAALNTQILSVAPALNAVEVTGRASVASSNTTQSPPADVFLASSNEVMPWGKGNGVQVDFTVRTPGDGYAYIFAIAGNPGTTTATFNLAGPSGPLGALGSRVTVLGENRALTIDGNQFTDTFSAGYDYQYHLYQFPIGGAVTVQTGSWWGLDTVFKQSRQEFEAYVSRPPMACPNCGEPLTYAPATKAGSGVERYCKFDGFQYPRDWTVPSRPMPW